MAEAANLGIESTTAMLDQLAKAFDELESHRDSFLPDKSKWEDVKDYFQNLHVSLKTKFIELEEKERAFEEKQSETNQLLAEREAAVVSKEQALLDRLQELKDAAVSAIAEARGKYKVASPELVDVGGSKVNKVSTSINADPNTLTSVPEVNLPDNKSGEHAEHVAVEIKPRPELKQLCEQMDAKGLLKFLLENRKNLPDLREELSIALKSAKEPARLVLDSLEGFYPPDLPKSQENEKNTGLQSLRRTCILLMESVTSVLGSIEPGDNHPLSSEIKQQAKAIANEWKAKMAVVDLDASNGNSLEAQAFLQLLVTFSIVQEFDEDELCELVLAFSRRRQAPQLCRSLGLAHKMPGVVEALISSGKQIDAVHFVHAFQLTESFPPVPLLKAYLNDVRKKEQEKSETAGVTGAQKDANTHELSVLRTIIKCIEEYKLQEEYPLDSLHKQVSQLEKAKAKKKRMAEGAKLQAKRHKGSSGYTPRRPAPAADNRQYPATLLDERGLYHGSAERFLYAAPPAYDMPSHGSYNLQANTQIHYPYPDERAPPAPYSALSSYGGYMAPGVQPASNNYANYASTGVQPASNNYANYTSAGVQSASSSYGTYGSSNSLQPASNSYGSLQSSYQPYM